MIWIERNLKNCKSTLDLLRETLCADAPEPEPTAANDEELTAFNTLFSSMAAIPFGPDPAKMAANRPCKGGVYNA
jgi:hypothetical protein